VVLKHDFESSTQYNIHGTSGDYILVSNRMPHAGSHISIMMFNLNGSMDFEAKLGSHGAH